jgi:hypothetical protein
VLLVHVASPLFIKITTGPVIWQIPAWVHTILKELDKPRMFIDPDINQKLHDCKVPPRHLLRAVEKMKPEDFKNFIKTCETIAEVKSASPQKFDIGVSLRTDHFEQLQIMKRDPELQKRKLDPNNIMQALIELDDSSVKNFISQLKGRKANKYIKMKRKTNPFEDFREKVRQWFNDIDFNFGGTIDKTELDAEFKRLGLKMRAQDFIKKFDTDGNEELDADEFEAALIHSLDNVIPGFNAAQVIALGSVFLEVDDGDGKMVSCLHKYLVLVHCQGILVLISVLYCTDTTHDLSTGTLTRFHDPDGVAVGMCRVSRSSDTCQKSSCMVSFSSPASSCSKRSVLSSSPPCFNINGINGSTKEKKHLKNVPNSKKQLCRKPPRGWRRHRGRDIGRQRRGTSRVQEQRKIRETVP